MHMFCHCFHLERLHLILPGVVFIFYLPGRDSGGIARRVLREQSHQCLGRWLHQGPQCVAWRAVGDVEATAAEIRWVLQGV